MEMRFSRLVDSLPEKLQRFSPFPAAVDRTAYAALPPEVKNQILKMGESYLNYDFPALRATDFMSFKRRGNRADFEARYFARRQALNFLVLAECVEDQGRFLDDIINGIWAICEESAWQLPAHNSYIRDTPAHLLPDTAEPVLDLFACETGALLACVFYLLHTKLEEISSQIGARIIRELNHRIIRPYLNRHFWWMGRGTEPMCNWTTWCTQNVLLTVFLAPFTDDIRRQCIHKAGQSCDFFLKDYGEDGCCEEGAGYYRHAGLTLFGALNILNQVSAGHFQSLYRWSKIQNIAAYILNVHVSGKYYFNFADCAAAPGPCGAREYLFGRAAGLPNLMLFAAQDFQSGAQDLFAGQEPHINLYYLLQTVFHYSEIMRFDTSRPVACDDIFYPSTGLLIARSSRLALAVKAGGNDDSHNHNDTGSFILYKDGQPLFADIGVETYTKKTFSSERYEIWTMQSDYHNLPTIDGRQQQAGKEFQASHVLARPDAAAPAISMELATAYSLPEAISYTRKMVLNKEIGTVDLHDHTNAENVVLNFITYEKPVLTAPGRLQIGQNCEVLTKGAEFFALETLAITDARLKWSWDHDLYRLRLKMTGSDFKMTIC